MFTKLIRDENRRNDARELLEHPRGQCYCEIIKLKTEGKEVLHDAVGPIDVTRNAAIS